MKRFIIAFWMIMLVLSSTAGAFDGDRKGFVMGGGLGFAPVAHWGTDALFSIGSLNLGVSVNEENIGLGLHIMAGYAWDEKNLIGFESNVVGYDSDLFNRSMAQGFNGAVWYHYYGNKGNAPFSTIGLGAYTFHPKDLEAADPGGGMLLGGGYEFTPHVQVAVYLGFGATELNHISFNHSHLTLMISAMAF